MNNEIVNAMEELENWLADPSELGRKPAKIEYTASFEDEDGIKCMIFKFKKSLFGIQFFHRNRRCKSIASYFKRILEKNGRKRAGIYRNSD